MMYNQDLHIKMVSDVRAFSRHIVDERSVNFHPDDEFPEYINFDDNTPTITVEEKTLFNRLMDESFAACEKDDADIYAIANTELKTS